MIINKKLKLGAAVYNIEQTMAMLKNGVGILNIYIILIDRNSKNLMEIIPSTQIFRECYAKKSFEIIAIANGKREALETASELIIENLAFAQDADMFKSRF